jgi:hypothetical protein
MSRSSASWRLKIRRSLLDGLDDEIIVQNMGVPIGKKMRLPKTEVWDAYSANPHLPRALIAIVLIAEVITEVLNGGLFQLIMNPSGTYLPDFPDAFREVGRKAEAKILDRVNAMFPGDVNLRDHDKRVAFASSKIVPGGWEGLATARKTKLYKELESLEVTLADLIQSTPFFRAVASYVLSQPDSFEVAKG